MQFRVPNRPIDRAGGLATVLGEDRTDVLVTALREYLQDAMHDDAFVQEIAAAYFDAETTYEQLKALVGAEEAANVRVLKQELDGFIDEAADVSIAAVLADTSALVSLGIVSDPASYHDAHGHATTAVLDRHTELTARSVYLDTTFPLDDGENAALSLANKIDASLFVCDEFTSLGLTHASLVDTRLLTTPRLPLVFVRKPQLTPDEVQSLLDDSSIARSWDANSYVQRAHSVLEDAESVRSDQVPTELSYMPSNSLSPRISSSTPSVSVTSPNTVAW